MLFKIHKLWCQLGADLNDDPGEGARGEGGKELGELAGGLIAVGGWAKDESGTEGGFEREDAEEHGGGANLEGEMSVSPSAG